MTLFNQPETEAPLVEPGAHLSALVYDVETKRCLPGSGDWARGLDHCKGWTDYKGMGISVAVAYDYLTNAYMVFMDDNLYKFQNLIDQREHVVGFNSVRFDDQLCAAHDVEVTTSYDLLKEIRAAVAMMPKVETMGRRSYTLELLSQVNLGSGKYGSGAMAPMLYQRGRIGSLVSYCLRDVQVTKALFDLRLSLIDPNCGRTLKLRDVGGVVA